MVCGRVSRANIRASQGLGGHRPGRIDAAAGPDRQRKNARGVPLVPQSADVRRAAGPARALPRAVRLAAEGPGGGRRTEPARAHRRHRERGHPARRRVPVARRPGPHRRHPGQRARPLPAIAGRHRHHHAGIDLPDADLERARRPAQRRYGHHRRDPRARPDQARRPHGAVARTPRSARRQAPSTHRPVRDAAPARRSRPLPRRPPDRQETDPPPDRARSRHEDEEREDDRREHERQEGARGIAPSDPRRSRMPTSPRTKSTRNSPIIRASSATAPSPSSTPARARRSS